MTNEETQPPQEPTQDVAPPKPKQYLLMIDESMVAHLGKIFPCIMYVQVEGVKMNDNEAYTVLVNPVKE